MVSGRIKDMDESSWIRHHLDKTNSTPVAEVGRRRHSKQQPVTLWKRNPPALVCFMLLTTQYHILGELERKQVFYLFILFFFLFLASGKEGVISGSGLPAGNVTKGCRVSPGQSQRVRET